MVAKNVYHRMSVHNFPEFSVSITLLIFPGNFAGSSTALSTSFRLVRVVCCARCFWARCSALITPLRLQNTHHLIWQLRVFVAESSLALTKVPPAEFSLSCGCVVVVLVLMFETIVDLECFFFLN